MYIPALTWKECADFLKTKPVLLQSLGSLEQHGSIGPLGTDFTIPAKLAERLEKALPEKIGLLPPIPYGVCPYHQAYPGTVDIGSPALTHLLTAVGESMIRSGGKKFLFLNGHGGNDAAIDDAALNLWHRGGLAAHLNWYSIAGELNPAWSGGHGGAQEASVMMALEPEWVHKEKNLKPEQIHSLSPAFPSLYGNAIRYGGATIKIIRPTDQFTETGSFGGSKDESSRANADLGREIFDGLLNFCLRFVEDFWLLEENRRS